MLTYKTGKPADVAARMLKGPLRVRGEHGE
jgi:hypothetical protein